MKRLTEQLCRRHAAWWPTQHTRLRRDAPCKSASIYFIHSFHKVVENENEIHGGRCTQVMYGREEGAETLVEQMSRDQVGGWVAADVQQ